MELEAVASKSTAAVRSACNRSPSVCDGATYKLCFVGKAPCVTPVPSHPFCFILPFLPTLVLVCFLGAAGMTPTRRGIQDKNILQVREGSQEYFRYYSYLYTARAEIMIYLICLVHR